MMVKRISLAFIVATLLVVASPAFSQERVTSIPEWTELNSGRFDLAYDLNRLVPIVGKAEFSGDRVHLVVKDLINNDTVEIVAIGDTVYTRMNEERRWKRERMTDDTSPIGGGMPAIGPEDLTLWRVGDADVNGNPTTQYQLQFNPARLTQIDPTMTGLKLDLFIGKNDNFLHKDQETSSFNDPQLGALTLQIVTVSSAFNQPMVIGPPPADLVDAARTRSAFRAPSTLPRWARALYPYAAAQLKARR